MIEFSTTAYMINHIYGGSYTIQYFVLKVNKKAKSIWQIADGSVQRYNSISWDIVTCRSKVVLIGTVLLLSCLTCPMKAESFQINDNDTTKSLSLLFQLLLCSLIVYIMLWYYFLITRSDNYFFMFVYTCKISLYAWFSF